MQFDALPDEQTEVTVTMRYDPPAGALGDAVAQIIDNPEGKLYEDLKRFKTFIEK